MPRISSGVSDAKMAGCSCAVPLRDRGHRELIRPESSPPAPRKVERAVRVVEADDQGERASVPSLQVVEGAVNEVSRLHRLGGESRRVPRGVEPDRGGVLERPPRPAMVAAPRGMSPELALPLRGIDPIREPMR